MNISTFYKQSIRRKFRILTFVFILVIVIGYISYNATPETYEGLIKNVSEKISAIGFNEMSTFDTFIGILLNNLKASVIAILLGLIPFFFITVILVLFNALILGVFSAMFYAKTKSFSLVLALLVPHGIPELAAIILAGALGINLCYTITTKITGSNNEPISTTLKDTFFFFVKIVAPLLVVAAFIEAYITPLIGGLFI